MTRIAKFAATALLAAVTFSLPALAATDTSADRAATTAPSDQTTVQPGKTNNRAWPMTISMGAGSGRGCAGDNPHPSCGRT